MAFIITQPCPEAKKSKIHIRVTDAQWVDLQFLCNKYQVKTGELVRQMIDYCLKEFYESV